MADDLRDRVLDATFAEVDDHGLGGLTVEAVAARAGSSRATIYRHFPGGRDELVATTLRRDVVADAADLEELLVVGVGASMRFLLEHDPLRSILTLEPELLLPQFAFHRLDPILSLASDFAAPHLQRHLPGNRPDVAARAAEYLVRVVLSYCLYPSDHVDPADRASMRRLVRTHLVPALTSTRPSQKGTALP